MTMSPSPPPLLKLDVEIPTWPAMDRARLRLDVVRSCTGRVATIAGATAAAIGLFTGDLTSMSLLGDVVLTSTGVATLRLWRPAGHQKATATVMYLMPGTGLAALLIGERIVAGIHWAEALTLAVWTTATWVMRPARVARHMISPPPPRAVAPAVVEPVGHHPASRWWAQHVAAEDGAAPGTILETVERTGENAMRAVIRSAGAGRPVPDISLRALSALMDVPEEQISIGPVPGRGASVRLLTIGTPELAGDPATVWAQRIAPAAMPGAVLTSVRVGRPGAATPQGDA
jgi:hypothetical protein